MDVRLPGQDGFDTAADIKKAAQQQGREVPIVALTASDSAGHDARAHIFDGIMSKPVLEVDILATLAQHLPIRYRYETPQTERQPVQLAAAACPSNVCSGDVWALPAAWREAFAEACQQANISTLQTLIDDLSPDYQDVAAALRSLVDDFAYDTLEQLFAAVPMHVAPPQQGIGQ